MRNHVEVIDKFACIVTEQADGTIDSQNFRKLEVMKAAVRVSKQGSHLIMGLTTNDINLKVDLAPGAAGRHGKPMPCARSRYQCRVDWSMMARCRPKSWRQPSESDQGNV
ncbi:hypothetical protein O9992_16370 [Vibrio lentus]|nr:hypothetical protein [Vibrio lentus]